MQLPNRWQEDITGQHCTISYIDTNMGSQPPLSQPSSSNKGTTPQTQQKGLKSPAKRGRPWRV
ncbi:unnamed protein product [Prunus armeniaca]|uniref:Uncharacterized protein n=1 Tax=Prunus armeniaca TaxID=36596 RepID=A0A6J5TZ66_PRUAR|nr:unnamed protein product [Prunus armeniaca]